MFYACLRVKKDPKDQNGAQKIIKKAFDDRNDARLYLASIRDDAQKGNLYDQFWTE